MARAERADRWPDAPGVPHRTLLYPVGHGLNAAMTDDFKNWLIEPLSLS